MTYGWDQANRLVAYNSTATYAYNGDGLRMAKTLNGVPEAFTWDIADGLPLILEDGSTSFVTGPGGMALEQLLGGSVVYLHQDQLGSTMSLTDASGTVQMTAAYDAYGNFVTRTVNISTPFGYAGQYLDVESALYYLRARYYDAAVSQFLAVDPLLPSTRTAYGYALETPENDTDLTGLSDDWQRVVAHSVKSGWSGLVASTDRAVSAFGKAVQSGDPAGSLLRSAYRAPGLGRALAKAAPGIGFAIIFSEEYYGGHHSLLRSAAIAGLSTLAGWFAAETVVDTLGPAAAGAALGSSETVVLPAFLIVGCAVAVGGADVAATSGAQAGLDWAADRAGVN